MLFSLAFIVFIVASLMPSTKAHSLLQFVNNSNERYRENEKIKVWLQYNNKESNWDNMDVEIYDHAIQGAENLQNYQHFAYFPIASFSIAPSELHKLPKFGALQNQIVLRTLVNALNGHIYKVSIKFSHSDSVLTEHTQQQFFIVTSSDELNDAFQNLRRSSSAQTIHSVHMQTTNGTHFVAQDTNEDDSNNDDVSSPDDQNDGSIPTRKNKQTKDHKKKPADKTSPPPPPPSDADDNNNAGDDGGGNNNDNNSESGAISVSLVSKSVVFIAVLNLICILAL